MVKVPIKPKKAFAFNKFMPNKINGNSIKKPVPGVRASGMVEKLVMPDVYKYFAWSIYNPSSP